MSDEGVEVATVVRDQPPGQSDNVQYQEGRVNDEEDYGVAKPAGEVDVDDFSPEPVLSSR